MRLLHTGDWHLGRTIRGKSRIDEFARTLDEVVGIAAEENVDAVLIAGDVFDALSPPTDAQRLLYETLARLAHDKRRVVMIAGNHDSPTRMDAPAELMSLAGVHAVGTLPSDSDYRPIVVPARDGSHSMTVVAVPWVPERLAISYEALFGKADESRVDEEYAESMERALRFYCAGFVKDEINVLLGHMWVNKAVVMKGGGERPLQTDMIMGIKGGNLPKSANYIALGHVHKPQAVPDSPVAGASFFSGSLVQLDFGEAGQEKSVRVVEIANARTPADCKEVPITGGRGLRDVRATLDSLPDRVAECGDDYLRVFVTADGIVPALYEQVRDVLPNALDVQLVRTDVPPATTAPPHEGLEPRALVEMYYKHWKAVDEAPKPLLDLFSKLHEEAMDASA